MNSSAILQAKKAVVFGAGGSIGSAVAKEFAANGAEVFLAGRTDSRLQDVARQIAGAGGHASAASVDAMDDAAVDEYVNTIAKQAGSVDIIFNAVGPSVKEYRNGDHAVDLPLHAFMVPLTTIVRSQFITARAGARQMLKQRSGVIIFLTGGPARAHAQGTSAVGAAFGAIEALTRNLAMELGPFGVRVACVRSSAMPDTRTIQQTMEPMVTRMGITKEQGLAMLANLTMLKTSPSTSDTAKAAAFLASDNARMMTGTVLNSSGGAVAD
jgi:NAD(P)-dependent dehydrogenase (short-subunit alcohol dehydrogenase family)